MACQVRLTAFIQEIDAIRRCLFPTDDNRGSDNWLQQCKVAVSPIGDLIVLANERKIVVLSSKWDTQSSIKQFEISYSGLIHDYDKVKAVIFLPIIGKDGNTKLGPEWTSILVGFDSGHVRCYTENCELLFEEQFHAENITLIKCQSQHTPKPDIAPYLSPEEIYVQYQSNICILNGYQLCTVLQKCRAQHQMGVFDYSCKTLKLKKWGFQDQSVINNSAVVGLTMYRTFDHLLTVSTSRGFDSRYRPVAPQKTLILAAGSKPFLGYHYALEGGYQPALSDVAKAVASGVASKLKSTLLPGWLGGKSHERQTPLAAQPIDAMECRFGLCDLRRSASEIILSPDRKLAAVSDTLGRVLLVDAPRGIVLRIFKGYRDAQCSFMQVPEEKTTKHKLGNKVALFLIIYAPKKGTLEILSVQKGAKIATFSASNHSRLLHINYGLMGFPSPTKSRYICPYTTVLMDNDGQIKEFTVPFHFALSEKNNKRSRDIHLYKKLRHLFKSMECEEENLLAETANTCTELQTVEIKTQTVDMLLANKHAPAKVVLQAVQYFAENLSGEEADQLRVLCENASVLLRLYLFVLNVEPENAEEPANAIMKLEAKEMGNLQTLLDLSIANDYDKLPEVHVSFNAEASFSAAEFLSIFEISKADSIRLKDKADEEVMFRSSEILFQCFIAGAPKFEEDFQHQLIGSKIPTKNLFDLLVTYWVSRSLHINLNLEKEMSNLSRLIYALTKTQGNFALSTEYSEVSEFWEGIREVLADSVRPFPALIAAILCKNVAHKIDSEMEDSSAILEDDSMEILSQENVQWSILIGKLEDVSLLNIMLSKKPIVDDCPLPPLDHDKCNISLRYVMQKGKGSVTELVAKWLTSTGTNPRSVVPEDPDADEDESARYLPPKVPTNVKLVEQLGLLRGKFPYSLEASALLANMVWEYAVAWRKDMEGLGKLEAAVDCLGCVQDVHIKQGLYQLLWNAHLKIVMESACKLINKVGKLPKERLCRQDTGLPDHQVTLFLKITTDFLDNFLIAVIDCQSAPKPHLPFEDIWEGGSGQALVELLTQQRVANYDMVSLHYQLSLMLYMLTSFPVKTAKPVDNLFDSYFANIFFTDLQKSHQMACNRIDTRLNTSRMEFLCRIIRASMESVAKDDTGRVFAAEHVFWMGRCCFLARHWDLDLDVLRRYQIIRLYLHGFDSVGGELIPAVKDRRELGKYLLRVAAKRLKVFLAESPNMAQNYCAMTTMVAGYLRKMDDEWCQSTPLEDITLLASYTLQCFEEEHTEYRMARLFLESCRNLVDVNRT